MNYANFSKWKYESYLISLGSKNNKFEERKLKLRFRLIGVPSNHAIKEFLVETSNTFGQIKRSVQREYRLNPIIDINFIYKGKVLRNDLRISQIGDPKIIDPITIICMNSGGAKRVREDEDEIKKLIHVLSEKIIPYRFRWISRRVENKFKELSDNIPLLKLIFAHKFGRELTSLLENFSHGHRFDLSDFLHYNNKYGNNPHKLLDLLLEDFIKNYNEYNRYSEYKDFRILIFSTLLELIPLIPINEESVFYEALKLINDIQIEENGEIFQKLLEILKNSKISIEKKLLTFNVIDNKNFETLLDDFKSFILMNDLECPSELKLGIIDRFERENPKYSSILDKITPNLIKLIEQNINPELEKKINKILFNQGMICGNCGRIINEHKNFSEITFCEVCNKTFCQECIENEDLLNECEFCNRFICKTHEEAYSIINLEERNVVLCDICLEERKYQSNQIICKLCQNKILKCSNDECEINICRKHQIRCVICDKRYCSKCKEKFMRAFDFGLACHKCVETEIIECEECGIEIVKNYNAYSCSDCGKYLCEEHIFSVPDWGKKYCKECLENWKEYTFRMQAFGH